MIEQRRLLTITNTMFEFVTKLFKKQEENTVSDMPAVENDEIIAHVQGDIGAHAHDSMIEESQPPADLAADVEVEETPNQVQ